MLFYLTPFILFYTLFSLFNSLWILIINDLASSPLLLHYHNTVNDLEEKIKTLTQVEGKKMKAEERMHVLVDSG
jgi:hypothetical protein